jgi:hypothetical protein
VLNVTVTLHEGEGTTDSRPGRRPLRGGDRDQRRPGAGHRHRAPVRAALRRLRRDGDADGGGAGYIAVGPKIIRYDSSTRLTINNYGKKIAVGMLAQWKSLRDTATGVMLARKLEIN